MPVILAEILTAVLETLGLMGTLVTLVQFVKKQVAIVAVEHSPYGIEGQVNTIAVDLANGSYGLNALLVTMGTYKDDIMTAIAALPTGGGPVTLPPVPPAGYGGASIVDIADQVWNGAQPKLPTTPADALQQIARATNTGGLYDLPMTVGVFRVAQIDWPTETFYVADLAYPTFDPTAILASDTLLSFLTRTNPTWYVGQGWGPQTYVTLSQPGVTQVHYTTLIDEAAFSVMKASLGLSPSIPKAPIWPGESLVTFGIPYALAASVDIGDYLHGVVIHITAFPPDKPTYRIGNQTAHAHVGQIAFQSDRGDMEYPQNLSFPLEVYVPQTMVVAYGVKLRCVQGVVGTVTPWKYTV